MADAAPTEASAETHTHAPAAAHTDTDAGEAAGQSKPAAAASSTTEAYRTGVDDSAILDQVATLRREVEETQALVGEVEDVCNLTHAYVDNPVFIPKIHSLARSFSHIRRTRGDGNCFYRAFLISMGEKFVNARVHAPGSAGMSAPTHTHTLTHDAGSTDMQAKYEQLLEYVQGSLQKLLDFGYPEVTLPDFHEAMMDFLRAWCAPEATRESVCVPFRDKIQGLYIITYLRCLCSLEMLSHEDDYFAYVLGIAPHCATVRMFCEVEVEPAHNDADQLQIIALARAFKVGVTIGYVDASPGTEASILVFPQDEDASEAMYPRLVHVLYRPGHYDVAYPRE